MARARQLYHLTDPHDTNLVYVVRITTVDGDGPGCHYAHMICTYTRDHSLDPQLHAEEGWIVTDEDIADRSITA